MNGILARTTVYALTKLTGFLANALVYGQDDFALLLRTVSSANST